MQAFSSRAPLTQQAGQSAPPAAPAILPAHQGAISRVPFALETSVAPPPMFPQARPSPGLRGIGFWVLPLSMLGLVVLVTLVLLVAPPDAQTPISGMSQLLSMVSAAICTLIALRKTPRQDRRAKWAWRCILLGIGAYTTGTVVIAFISSTVTNSNDLITPADGFILPSYPLLLAGAFLFPSANSSWSQQVRSILDAFIAVGAVLGVVLVFLIVPRYNGGTLADYIYILYPLNDTIAALVLIMLLIRGKQQPYYAVCFWLLVGFLCLAYSDAAFNYLTLPLQAGGAGYIAEQAAGSPIEAPIYFGTGLAFSLGALLFIVQRNQLGPGWGWLERLMARFASTKATTLRTQILVLFFPLLILGGVLLYAQLEPQAVKIPLLALTSLTLVVVGLIIARQLLTTRDLVDARSATERAEQLDELKDQFITSINHELRTPVMTMRGLLENYEDLETLRTQLRTGLAHQGDLSGRAARAREVIGQVIDNLRREERKEPITQAVYRSDLLQSAQVCADIAEAFQRESRISEQLAILLNHGLEASSALMRMITNILDVRRYEQGASPVEPRVVPVRRVVQETVLLVELGHRHLANQVPERLAVWADPALLQEILTNLISNAVKYSPDASTITVTASPWNGGSGERSRVVGAPGRKMVELVVRDEGFGIPANQRDLLFRKFVRLPRDLASTKVGTGLGLYLCRVHAESMGGQIWAESAGENLGSSFHLCLPVPPPAATRPQPPQGTEVGSTGYVAYPAGRERRQ